MLKWKCLNCSYTWLKSNKPDGICPNCKSGNVEEHEAYLEAKLTAMTQERDEAMRALAILSVWGGTEKMTVQDALKEARAELAKEVNDELDS